MNMQVWLNLSRYLSLDMATDFAKEQYTSRFMILLADNMGLIIYWLVVQ